MSALNFKKQFVGPIRADTKAHTIRADRKDGRMPYVGELYTLYCGMRTKNCFRILEDQVEITQVQRIEIVETHLIHWLFVDGISLDNSEQAALAKADGFKSVAAFYTFWKARLPFSGNIIHWRPI